MELVLERLQLNLLMTARGKSRGAFTRAAFSIQHVPSACFLCFVLMLVPPVLHLQALT